MNRNYTLTINNYTEADICKLKSSKYRYIIVGDEVGEQKTPHLQIYICFKNQRSFSAVKKDFPNAHIEVAKGNHEQNREYCSKQKILFEDGSIPRQGTRSDIQSTYEFAETCSSVREFMKTQPNLQNLRIFEKVLTHNEPPRTWKTIVKWYYGPTGTGKTRQAFQEMPQAYWCNETSKWFDGYDAHEDVIIDDMRGDFCKFHDLLRLLDRYPYRVQIKGGYRQWKPKRIIITSCYSPQEMYKYRDGEDIKQLLRRISQIKEFKSASAASAPLGLVVRPQP